MLSHSCINISIFHLDFMFSFLVASKKSFSILSIHADAAIRHLN